MPIDDARAKKLLHDFNFPALFVEELGWDKHKATLSIPIDNRTFELSAVAEKRGMAAFVCQCNGALPDYNLRRKIERQVAKSAHEHFIIFTDAARTRQIWQWVKREPGKPAAAREHHFDRSQTGEALIQKLKSVVFELAEEENLTLVDVTIRARAGFDVEKVTKRFYERFQKEHAAFLKFIKGIPDDQLQRWYASVMLNRLMFIYFIQKKGFLSGDINYLRNKLTASKPKDRYYSGFLCPLFFEGFAKKSDERSTATNQLLGPVPYLNGGLFLRHQIEELHSKSIQIPDTAFERIFDFFEAYQWHLDERPLRADNEINPDVLGYIFEKYINSIQPGEQKAQGAYYTREDTTEDDANIVFALLCSSMGYWWWAVASDAFNLKKWLLERFPISISLIPNEARKQLAQLGAALRLRLKRHYVFKENKGRIGNFFLPACEAETVAIDNFLAHVVADLSPKFFEDIRDFNDCFSRAKAIGDDPEE